MPSNVVQANAGRPGVVPIEQSKRSSQVITTIIPANSSFPIFQAGNKFYLPLATAAIDIKPNGGSFATYTQGTGQGNDNSTFDQVQIRNNNAFNVIISIFVGFGDYIDQRAILYDPLVQTIVYPTYPVANAAVTVNIPDLSGQSIVDLNGTVYLAIARVGIYISNLDVAAVYTLSDYPGIIGSVLAIQAQTEITFPVSGNYKIRNGVAPVNCFVSEAYRAVQPTLIS